MHTHTHTHTYTCVRPCARGVNQIAQINALMVSNALKFGIKLRYVCIIVYYTSNCLNIYHKNEI